MSNEREDLEGRIAAYIDGELSPADAARLEVYLANSDPKLADQIIGMLADKHRLTSLSKPRAPEDLAARIMEQVERASLLNNVDQLTAHRPWWQSRAAVAAALFLFVGGLTYFIMQGLHPANPAWQAALQPAPRPPAIAAAPSPAVAPIVQPISTPSTGVTTNSIEAGGGGGRSGAAAGPLITSAASVAPRDDVAATTARNRLASDQLGSLDIAHLADKKNEAKLDELAMKTTKDSLPGAMNKSPLVLALIADDPGDFARLHVALDTLLAGASANASDRSKHSAQSLEKTADRELDQGAAALQNSSNSSRAETSNQVAAQQSPAQMQAGAANLRSDNGLGGGANSSAQNTSPASYHVMLRRADIEQLTRQFHVQPSDALKAFAFGSDAATIATTSPADGQLYKNVDPSSAAAIHALPASPPISSNAQSNTAAQTDTLGPSDAPIDCIITMTPPPAPTTQESPH